MDIKKTWLFTKPIAHRGLHNDAAPENSLSAFENAVNNGYPIEMDIRTIDDGTVIVFHDDKLGRMTGNDGYVCNLSKSALAEIRLGDTQEKIPTFAEFLEFINGRTPILIEVKSEGKAGQLERDALELLKNYKGEYAVQSFSPYSMEFFKTAAPEIMRGQLSCFFKNSNLGFFKKQILKKLKLNKISSPDFISYDEEDLPNKYVTKTKLPVLAWTVRSNTTLEKVLPYCDNVIFEGFVPVVNK